MTEQYRGELRVDHVHRLSSRSLLLLSGPRSGQAIAIGDPAIILTPAGDAIRTAIKTIEFHNRLGMTTVGVDSDAGEVPVGSVLRLL